MLHWAYMPGSVKGTYLRFLTVYACAYALGLVVFALLSFVGVVTLEHAELALVLALIPPLYYLFGFRFAVSHVGRRGAYMLGVGLASLPILFVSLASGGLESPNNLAFALLIFLSAMLGFEMLLLLIWVQLLGYLLGLGGLFVTMHDTMAATIYLVISGLAAATGWVVFHRYRVREDPMVEHLRRTLHQEQLQSEAVIAAISDGVAIVSREGRVIHSNNQFLQVLALEYHELVGKYYKDVANANVRIVASTSATPRVGQNIATVLATGKPVVIDSETLEYVDGRPSIDVSVSVAPLKNDDGEVSAVMIIARDITHIMRLQRMKDALIATASHELRTPITVIAGYADLLLGASGGGLNDKQRHYLERTKETTAHLTSMVNDMLDISRLESGERENNPEDIDLAVFLPQMIEEHLGKFAARSVSLRLEGAEGKVRADKSRLRQVVGNLLSNACKFTQEGGEAVLSSRQKGDMIEIAVTDNGPGVSLEHQKSIFEKFTKLDTTGSYPGAGLGLAIARAIVEAWGGTITVESVEPQGAKFSFSVPGTQGAVSGQPTSKKETH